MDSFPPRFLQSLERLPLEIKAMILIYVAAQDVNQLREIRLWNRFWNTTIVNNEASIVWTALNSKDSMYYIADSLYYSIYSIYRPVDPGSTTIVNNGTSIVVTLLPSKISMNFPADCHSYSIWEPVDPGFQYLFGMARRCDLARQLATLLAVDLEMTLPSLRERRLDGAPDAQFIRNLEPYLLGLAYFFECYRNKLVDDKLSDEDYTGTRRRRGRREAYTSIYEKTSIDDNPIFEVLFSKYNQETQYRLCALYRILKRIFDGQLDCYYQFPRADIMGRMPDWTPPFLFESRDEAFVELFVFAGINAVKDVIEEREPGRCRELIYDHLCRAYPCSTTRRHNLPPSTLPRIGQENFRRVARRLPRGLKDPILNFKFVGWWYSPRERPVPEVEEDGFCEHLLTYKGNPPQLVPEDDD